MTAKFLCGPGNLALGTVCFFCSSFFRLLSGRKGLKRSSLAMFFLLSKGWALKDKGSSVGLMEGAKLRSRPFVLGLFSDAFGGRFLFFLLCLLSHRSLLLYRYGC